MKSTSKIERSITAALEDTKLPYRIVDGTKHKKVFICGQMVGVFSAGRPNKRDDKAFVSTIRQFCRSYESRSI